MAANARRGYHTGRSSADEDIKADIDWCTKSSICHYIRWRIGFSISGFCKHLFSQPGAPDIDRDTFVKMVKFWAEAKAAISESTLDTIKKAHPDVTKADLAIIINAMTDVRALVDGFFKLSPNAQGYFVEWHLTNPI